MKRDKYKVLYIAPRYHTNQIPIIGGWIERGNKVLFVSQYIGDSEDYSIINPLVVGYSRIFEMIARIYSVLFCWKEKSLKKELNFRTKLGIPPFGRAKKIIGDFQPDVVIVRERFIYNVPFVRVCRKKKIPCILYNQSPLWDYSNRDAGVLKRILLPYFPKVRITPTLGEMGDNRMVMPDSVFVPFVVKPHCLWEENEHFKDGYVRLVCVGRYEERKNLTMLLKVINRLKNSYKILLTIVGECKNEGQQEYYAKVEVLIREYQLESMVFLKKNYNINEVYKEYEKADLFVLPSTKERASISQLEAMSCSLPIICSDTNGSACYVKNGVNGYLFKDNDAEDLQKQIEKIISDKENIVQMGKSSYRLVKTDYSFEKYREKICEIIEGIEDEDGL